MKKYNGNGIFKNRSLVIATMHGKEQVIAPLFKDRFNMICQVPLRFNTDQFGTFSGEIPRIKNSFQTARDKALAALSGTIETLAIASEGSFGSHPESPFIIGNEELVVLVDIKNDFEIIGHHFTENTNFSHEIIKNLNDIKEFATRIGFPEHGLILKYRNVDNSEKIVKDFKSLNSLLKQVLQLLNKGKIIYAETDMRAMNNPTRMKAIGFATENLIDKINSLCPQCQAPGFSIINSIRGLRCELCHLPTKGVKAYIYSCQKCDFSSERVKEGIRFQDPIFCDYCNP